MTAGTVGAGFIPGLIVVIAIVAVIMYLIKKTEKEFNKEYKLK